MADTDSAVYDSLQLTFDGNDSDVIVGYIAFGIPLLVLLFLTYALVFLTKAKSFWGVPALLLQKVKNPTAWFYTCAVYFLAWISVLSLMLAR